jgi:guanylate kinase
MGIILGTKMSGGDKVVFEVEVSYAESLRLKGHVKNIHIFSEDAAEIKTNLSQRGTNEATKYFLIPRELRDGLKFSKDVKCQKIETDTENIFIFVVDKNTGKS